jgi:hypothetical protein
MDGRLQGISTKALILAVQLHPIQKARCASISHANPMIYIIVLQHYLTQALHRKYEW